MCHTTNTDGTRRLQNGGKPQNFINNCGKKALSIRRSSWRFPKSTTFCVLIDCLTAIFVIHYIYYNTYRLNPWNFPNIYIWAFGFISIRCAILFYDYLVVFFIDTCLKSKVLATRQVGAPPIRCIGLDARSISYLSINAFNEYVFVMQLTHYLWHGGYNKQTPLTISEITLCNTVIALGVMFVSMDMLYAPLHHLMHLPVIYPLIHKHHHRQHFPVRGYLDAGNEHPLEHMIGVICTWFAVFTAEMLLPTFKLLCMRVTCDGWEVAVDAIKHSVVEGGGVHAYTIIFFFQLHAALAMLNHSPYDVKFSLPFAGSSFIFGSDNLILNWVEKIPLIGQRLKRIITGEWFNYSVCNHEMHHRKFNYNYGQYCMFYDHWMGTFIDYEGPLTAVELEARKIKSKMK